MRVTLCYPPLLPGRPARYGLQPLGVLHIAATLRRAGFAPAVLDADHAGCTIEETVDRILATAPELVGVSLMTPQLLSALACCTRLRERRPDLPIVLGGAHVDSTKGDVFEAGPVFDFAIHGEGEQALVDCCRRLQGVAPAVRTEPAALMRQLGDVANAIVRDPASGRIVVNPARPFVADLDDLPSVDYDLVDVRGYRIPTMPGRFVVSLMCSRGCPFRCTFCDAPFVMGRKFRHYSVARLVSEIRNCVERYGARDFVFKDSTFTANRRWARAFCDALIASDLRIRWRCNTRANLIPQPLLERMAAAGCHIINFGVESGDPEVLRRIRKEVDLEEVVDAFERCRRLGIRTYATFLVGSPGETDASFRRTLAFARRIRPSLCFFGVATAYPGTPMYEEAVAAGEIEPRWWARFARPDAGHSDFEVRWGWTAHGALHFANGFDAERWQRLATRSWYLRPRFLWDSLLFSFRHPRHLWQMLALARELVPWQRLRARSRRTRVDERLAILARCPSAPYWPYEAPPGAGAAHDSA